MSIEGASEDITHDQSVLIYDDSWMLTYGGGILTNAIWSDHPIEKLLRGLMIRLRPYESDPRVNGETLLDDFELSLWAVEHPPLPELGHPDAYESDNWSKDPRTLVQERLHYKPTNSRERMKLEYTSIVGRWPQDPESWPDTHTLPVTGDTLLQRWRLDGSKYPSRTLGNQADLRLGMILYLRMLESTAPDRDDVTRAQKIVLTKIRAILIYVHEAYKCITEEDIEAIYQEVRATRDRDFHKKPNARPTNFWDAWMPIINHVRFAHVVVDELMDRRFQDLDYDFRPVLWNERFTTNNLPVRKGCRTWKDLKTVRNNIEDVWYHHILRSSPPWWRTDRFAEWVMAWKEDHRSWFSGYAVDGIAAPISHYDYDKNLFLREGLFMHLPGISEVPPRSTVQEEEEPRPDWIPDI